MDWLVGGNHHKGRQIPPPAVFVVVGVVDVLCVVGGAGGVVGVAVAVLVAIAIAIAIVVAAAVVVIA